MRQLSHRTPKGWAKSLVMVVIYTTCQYVCRLLVENVKRIEAALDGEERHRVIFVLVTFDSERDTPQRRSHCNAQVERIEN